MQSTEQPLFEDVPEFPKKLNISKWWVLSVFGLLTLIVSLLALECQNWFFFFSGLGAVLFLMVLLGGILNSNRLIGIRVFSNSIQLLHGESDYELQLSEIQEIAVRTNNPEPHDRNPITYFIDIRTVFGERFQFPLRKSKDLSPLFKQLSCRKLATDFKEQSDQLILGYNDEVVTLPEKDLKAWGVGQRIFCDSTPWLVYVTTPEHIYWLGEKPQAMPLIRNISKKYPSFTEVRRPLISSRMLKSKD